ncbi:hypothetical protein NKR23_g6447 [Pleurostoma richardsiae]|uniref:Large ribosomal subunit protein bL27m n=1 Tax=Pleurostoma richardsiae TaxID=41990 RepID=A0AA38VHW2_9PEZI|nr:hypothetical protein NKR23_g6447 [Pleurostoma richardsiae]
MRIVQLQRPLQALAAGSIRPSLTFTLPLRPGQPQLTQPRLRDGNAAVEGRRYAAVKSQGAYKLRPRKTIPKKLGAKRTGDQYVIPGNIIYKQRGTIWHPGENTILGRDHTIHAAVSGYVKYYRDPLRHPTRQYIGVAFKREDKLPYPPHAVRKRRLGFVAVPRKEPEAAELLSPSGIPRRVVRKDWEMTILPPASEAGASDAAAPAGGAAAPAAESSDAAPAQAGDRPSRARRARSVHPFGLVQQRWREVRGTRVLHLNKDYSYAEGNSSLGRLVGKSMYIAPWKIGGRKGRLRKRRRLRQMELERRKKEFEMTRRMLAERKEASRGGAKKQKQQQGGGGGKKEKRKKAAKA